MTADSFEYDLLKENARANRNNMTEAESSFWSMVKGSALGQKCLRQHVIGDFIVDFLFRKSKVIVEIDGGYHFTNTPPTPLFRGEQEFKPLTGNILSDLHHKEDTPRYIDPEQMERDRIRQDWLEHQGYKVIRFTNEEVLFDTDNIINKIKVSLNREI